MRTRDLCEVSHKSRRLAAFGWLRSVYFPPVDSETSPLSFKTQRPDGVMREDAQRKVWIQAGSQDNNDSSNTAADSIHAGGRPKQHFQERKDTFAF